MKVSIIIPTLGRATLKSVLEALFLSTNFDQIDSEIIVVFDGVDPNYSDDRVKVLSTKRKVYAAGARNLALEHATGDIITFIGDDTIPTLDWLQRLRDWHVAHPEKNEALLGKVAWINRLASDPFHQWLEQKALFDYARLDKGAVPNWRHFYTSNISVKKLLLTSYKFSDKFAGWGFEDSEFGYRLAKEGMKLSYDSRLVVKHDDEQTLEGLIKRTKQARANAQVFQNLHPEVEILPRGAKKILLKAAVTLSAPLQFVNQVKWWRVWKQAWLG